MNMSEILKAFEVLNLSTSEEQTSQFNSNELFVYEQCTGYDYSDSAVTSDKTIEFSRE